MDNDRIERLRRAHERRMMTTALVLHAANTALGIALVWALLVLGGAR